MLRIVGNDIIDAVPAGPIGTADPALLLRDIAGRNMLFVAIEKDDREAVARFLSDAHTVADDSDLDNKGRTPLIYAAQLNRINILRMLLESKKALAPLYKDRDSKMAFDYCRTWEAMGVVEQVPIPTQAAPRDAIRRGVNMQVTGV